jgi:hypothetical protein
MEAASAKRLPSSRILVPPAALQFQALQILQRCRQNERSNDDATFEKLLSANGFRYEIDATRIQSGAARISECTRGDHNDRNRSRLWVGSKPARGFQSIHFRHSQIHQNDVGMIFGGQINASTPLSAEITCAPALRAGLQEFAGSPCCHRQPAPSTGNREPDGHSVKGSVSSTAGMEVASAAINGKIEDKGASFIQPALHSKFAAHAAQPVFG